MGASLTSIRVIGTKECSECGQESDLCFAYGGRIRCKDCEFNRIYADICIKQAIVLFCFLAAIVVLFIAMTIHLLTAEVAA